MLENIQEILNYWQPAPIWRRLLCWIWQILENQLIKRDGREGEMLINIAKHRNASDGN